MRILKKTVCWLLILSPLVLAPAALVGMFRAGDVVTRIICGTVAMVAVPTFFQLLRMAADSFRAANGGIGIGVETRFLFGIVLIRRALWVIPDDHPDAPLLFQKMAEYGIAVASHRRRRHELRDYPQKDA